MPENSTMHKRQIAAANRNSGQKLRNSQKQKDATPIKEEDDEQNTDSEGEEVRFSKRKSK